MRLTGTLCAKSITVLAALGSYPAFGQPQRLFPTPAVNDAQYSASAKLDGVNPIILKAEVRLDRAGFSPGAIDGKLDDNVRNAIAAFQQANGLEPTGNLDQTTWDRLTQASGDPVLVEYRITEQDVAGPFTATIPQQLHAMASLKRLSYRSATELLAAKFHTTQALLRRLNEDQRLDRAGNAIRVPNVDHPRPSGEVTRIEVDKTAKGMRALDQDGKLIAFYPASIGSQEKPAPTGEYHVRNIVRNPTYHYDPRFHFHGVKVNHKLTIAAGPNNPVGLVWIDLTKDSYGIHGTPDPARIGKTHSHGCIRLTNWDALDLAGRVRKGTPVDFFGEPSVALSRAK
jgi:lipoprotein-anchoring transpeptidase ErfK/SrfK